MRGPLDNSDLKSNVARSDVAKHVVEIHQVADYLRLGADRSRPSGEGSGRHLVDDDDGRRHTRYDLLEIPDHIGRKPGDPDANHFGPGFYVGFGLVDRLRHR